MSPDPKLANVLGVLAEKMGLTPAEFAAKTIVIEGGNARVDEPELTEDDDE